ncbi:MAG: hypothetical protein HQM03_06160 [Magnetococcales bacterium]|nr:hypothetical protein [Magnetococcales bacterium]
MRKTTLLLASAVLTAGLMVAPAPAKADPTLAVALGGAALFTSLSHWILQPGQPSYQVVSAQVPYYPQPVVYQTVSPVVYQQPPIIMMAVPRY